MQPIRYLQIDAISVCFSPTHIARALQDIVNINPEKIMCFYNIDPSYYTTDPIFWYNTGVQCVRFPVLWSDTEDAYRIICLLKYFGQTEIAQLGTIRPCTKATYKQQVVYIPSVKRTPNIVSDDEEDDYEEDVYEEDDYEEDDYELDDEEDNVESESLLDFYEDRTPGNPEDFVEIIYNIPQGPERAEVVNPDDYELYVY